MHLPHLAARTVGLFNDGNFQAMERQPQGGGQSGDAGPDDNDPFSSRHAP
jgi:hypothetical protein